MEEWESRPPRRKSEKVTVPPQELGREETSLQLEESDTIHQLEEMKAAKVKRHPASDPFPQHKTTRKLPSAHSGTALSRSIQPEP